MWPFIQEVLNKVLKKTLGGFIALMLKELQESDKGEYELNQFQK